MKKQKEVRSKQWDSVINKVKSLLSLSFSLVDVDLFGDLIPSTAENGIQNKDIFDIASLGDSLPDSKEKDNKTPETFLGPNASSLVNLDSLVIVPQSMKSRNPFLAGRLHRQDQQHGILYRNLKELYGLLVAEQFCATQSCTLAPPHLSSLFPFSLGPFLHRFQYLPKNSEYPYLPLDEIMVWLSLLVF